MKITGRRAVELIRDSESWRIPGVEVYWFDVESRTSFCEEIVKARGNLPIIPLQVTRGFNDGNTVGEDLVRLIIDNQYAFLGISVVMDSHVALVLVSRESLRIPQVSSPMELPSWFPGFGGTQINVAIKDFRRSLLASLKSPEARVTSLHSLMYAIDKEMLRILEGNQRAFDRVLQLIQRPPPADGKKGERNADPVKISEFREAFLKSWKEILFATTDPSAYRLEMAREATLAARLVGLVGKTAPESLGKIAGTLAELLQLDTVAPRTLQALMWRPLSRETELERIAGRQLLVVMYVVHQYTTAAAHADAYPSYPIALLQSISEELVAALSVFVDHLESVTVIGVA